MTEEWRKDQECQLSNFSRAQLMEALIPHPVRGRLRQREDKGKVRARSQEALPGAGTAAATRRLPAIDSHALVSLFCDRTPFF